MKKSIIISIFMALVLILPQSVRCQDANALEKQYKETISILKKSYNDIKKVEVVVESDGNWYFRLEGKKNGDKVYGVADKSGNIIIPLEYMTVKYYVKEAPGKVREEVPNFFGPSSFNTYFHKGSETPVFYLEKDNIRKIFSLSDYRGNMIIENVKFERRTPGYWLIINSDNKRGLLTTDGKIVLDLKYDFIFLGTTAEESDELYEAKIREISFTKNVDGIDRRGGMLVDGSAPFVDALFTYVDIYPCETGKYKYWWRVKKNMTDGFKAYDPKEMNVISYRDEGEKFFDQKNYDKVIEFYANEGIDSPWAKYFSGKACYEKAFEHVANCSRATSSYESNLIQSIKDEEPFDLEEAQQLFELAYDLLNHYLESPECEDRYKTDANAGAKMATYNLENLPNSSFGFRIQVRFRVGLVSARA